MRITVIIKNTLLVIGLVLLSGCSDNDGAGVAREYARKSQANYTAALNKYKTIISRSQNGARYNFELGALYYAHGDFGQAIDTFKRSDQPQAKIFLAIALYRMGDFTEALGVFNTIASDDPQCLYYHGLTCERLNLFDQALSNYRTIKDEGFKQKARVRIEAIEKKAHAATIQELDPFVYKIISSAPLNDAYPQAGALILYADEKTEITEQNTQVTSLHYIIKIINERGKESFAETGIDYDSTFERVELEYARTIKPDGTVTDVGTRHIRDVSKYLNFPLYSNARVAIISFPEIVEGACIEYKLKVYRSQLVNKKDFNSVYPLQAQEPVITAHFQISVPETKTLAIKNINQKFNDFKAPLAPEAEKKSGRITYQWRFKDIPQIIPEAHMPALSEINPTIMVSTFSSWDDVYQWWWNLARDKIAADSQIKQKVKELLGVSVSEEEKARLLYNYCAQKIRYVAVEYGQAGYEPHAAADIFKNKYGDCKDQAILLVTMLKEAGLSAYPVLISTRDYYNAAKDFPAIIFNHCIAAVEIKSKTVFLDPTAQTCPFGDLPRDDQGRTVVVFKDSGYRIEETPRFDSGHNGIRQDLRISIAADETMQAQKEIFTSGVYDQGQRYWLLFTQPELVQETLKEKIQEVSIGASLLSYSIDNLADLNKPIVLRYHFSGPEFLTAAGTLRIMPQLATVDTSLVAKDRRRYPIDFGFGDKRELLFEIAIPDNFVIKYMPVNVTRQTPWFRFQAQYRLQDKNKIVFRQVMEIIKDAVAEKEYPAFKAAFENTAKSIKQRIVIEKVK